MQKQSFTINILTTDGPQYDYLINKLEKKFNINLVIRELGKYQRKRLLAQKKYWRYFCNRYQKAGRDLFGYTSYRKKYFQISNPIRTKFIDVENINSKHVVDLLTNTPCNLCIVMGTSILKDNVIKACNTKIINIHGGYLPDYRGNNCIYFAVLKNDLSKIANTIHYIDDGIDTGDIIEIVDIKPRIDDTPETLYCKAKRKAIDRLVYLIENYQNTMTLPQRAQDKNKGHLYLTEERNPLTSLVYCWMRLKKYYRKLIKN